MITPSKETDLHHLHHHIENDPKAYTQFLMLCTECQAIHNSGPATADESTREASDGQIPPGLSQGRGRATGMLRV